MALCLASWTWRNVFESSVPLYSSVAIPFYCRILFRSVTCFPLHWWKGVRVVSGQSLDVNCCNLDSVQGTCSPQSPPGGSVAALIVCPPACLMNRLQAPFYFQHQQLCPLLMLLLLT